ncbi:MAG: UvrD-helicase domain-containing protein [bacterium]|nr:UvrD-helicase domain-containing protein [bacterium]
MEQERKKLTEVVKVFEELIEETHLRQEMVKRNYSNDLEMMVYNLNKLESQEKVLKVNIEKPYFARIDFQSDDLETKDVCYIGKIGTIDADNKIITVDWRTPIASLYYDSPIGATSYIAPEGKITGNLLVKRQYEIENRNLISYQDVDSVSNDELLKPYLSSSVDARLKNIVSTIQKEQNQIIRETIDQDIIVQGVAGSGKTTVALHRIAYLVYQNKDVIDISQYMIIGPNKFFVNYISNVLPDLDVEGVGEFDLLEFTSNYLGEKIKLAENQDTPITKYKMTLEYKTKLDTYIEHLAELVVPDTDLEMFGFTIVPRNEIIKLYQKASMDTVYLNDKVERTQMSLVKYIVERQEKLMIKANSYIDDLFVGEKDLKVLTELSKKREQLRNEIKNKCSHLLKKYFKVVTEKTTSLYFDFLDTITTYDENPLWNNLKNMKKIC